MILKKDSKTMNKDNLITKAFCISETNAETIKKLGEAKGLNDSASLRVIINEWAEMRKEYVRIPVIDKVK